MCMHTIPCCPRWRLEVEFTGSSDLQEELPLMRTSSGLMRTESMRLAKMDTHTSLQTRLRQQLHQRKLACLVAIASLLAVGLLPKAGSTDLDCL